MGPCISGGCGRRHFLVFRARIRRSATDRGHGAAVPLQAAANSRSPAWRRPTMPIVTGAFAAAPRAGARADSRCVVGRQFGSRTCSPARTCTRTTSRRRSPTTRQAPSRTPPKLTGVGVGWAGTRVTAGGVRAGCRGGDSVFSCCKMGGFYSEVYEAPALGPVPRNFHPRVRRKTERSQCD